VRADIVVLDEIDLYEITLTDTPANPECKVVSVTS